MPGEIAASRRAERMAAVLAAFAFAAALLSFAGWFIDVPRLTDWDADGIAQMPNNALAVGSASAALLCALFDKRGVARVLAGLAALIALATLFEHATSIDLGIDTLLITPRWGQRGTVAPGRMGVPASVSLLLISASAVLLTIPRLRRRAVAGGLVTIVIAMLSVIGYAFGADPLFSLPRSTSIALQTSVMLLALGCALTAAVPDALPMRFLLGDSGATLLVRRALPAIILLPIILGWLRMKGQEAGLFDAAFGTALLVLALIALLVTVLLSAASAISAHEEDVRRSRDRLAAILGSITDPFLTVDPDWTVAFVNAEAESLLGGSVAGKNMWDAVRGASDPALHERLRQAMEERVAVDYELFAPSMARWFLIRAFPKGNGGLALHWRDVTERKTADEALRDSERKFALLFQKAAFGAVLARLPGGVIADVNEAFASMFGFTREEAIGKTSLQLGINPDAEARARLIDLLDTAGTVRDFEMHLFTRTGQKLLVLNSATTIEIGGQRYLLTTMQDITEQRAAEEALRTSERVLREADRMKDEFLATLSHELRTPLTAIVGWSQILLMGGLEKREQHVALEAIRSSARAQAQLIEDVLDVSRMITGKMRLEREDTDLAAVIEAAVATVRPAAEAKRIAIDLTLDRTLPRMFVDPERIQQIVWNLLSNAIKFSPDRTTVTTIVRAEGESVCIEVADSGPGIAGDFLQHIFERFRQADSSTSRTHGGLGIGLALVKELVELHGGNVSVESEVGQGSRFIVRLPMTRVPNEVAPQESAIVAEPSTSLRGVRVLYVDDRADARTLVATMLQHYGAQVLPAASVDDALVALAAELPDVVVTDLAMPVRDGYDLLASIRADARFERVPVLALTAQRRIDDEARAFQAGFRSFLRKPIEPVTLAEAVSRAVTNARS